jgi:hypothetical protein
VGRLTSSRSPATSGRLGEFDPSPAAFAPVDGNCAALRRDPPVSAHSLGRESVTGTRRSRKSAMNPNDRILCSLSVEPWPSSPSSVYSKSPSSPSAYPASRRCLSRNGTAPPVVE